jgi:hypothetical protein
MPTLISIISDQPIPNLIFIKQMELPDMKYIMLSTEDMERNKISSNIALAANLPEGSLVIHKIPHADPIAILRKMESLNWDKKEKYIINITGGTKIMSQMVYQFFTNNKFNVEIYYTPISEPFWTILYPKLNTVSIDSQYQLTLYEYFLAHGYSYTYIDGFSFPIDDANKLMALTIKQNGSENVDQIKKAKSEAYYSDDKVYLTGEWFEDWCFNIIKESLNLHDSQISKGIQIKSHLSDKIATNDNEIDVAFVYDNKLYLIECKVFNKIDNKKIGDVIYKSASIRQTLGLQAISLIFLCSNLGRNNFRKSMIKDKCRLMKIKRIFTLEDLKNIKEILKEIV